MNTYALLGVSRETNDRLRLFEAELVKWNSAINLVSPASLQGGFVRHIADSAQIMDLAKGPVAKWADLGSGGGFPGIVIGIIAASEKTVGELVLVESDARKCAFLRETCRKLDLSIRVENARIEKLPAQGADVVSARALAPLARLLEYTHPHLLPEGVAFFPKGVQHMAEIDEARIGWDFDVTISPSKTDNEAAVLSISNLQRKKTAGKK